MVGSIQLLYCDNYKVLWCLSYEIITYQHISIVEEALMPLGGILTASYLKYD